ncbi:hypothetical protein A8924_3501 [Saccharopolyspora erythraea NRRL 2338]|uniref:Uncharacterized protein n=4 Tax=Saccharopolyspora erythraea TaxID=1836 RepID=A4FEB1_SACEN|nr:GTPase-associated protein 1-related protein [Saccharopolyspora erythraea]PFG96113.1 hypothetical protein A8924_3501 [Saccharopolyspora erythraea NRRL 2338]QRK92652.1 hypothetical protein JQX30_15950 [Saccharopolyspora erythraea]CAM02386.1 hypothetical protein SACE_3108 [Saccharopolyspora erythraea NRRL 2338]
MGGRGFESLFYTDCRQGQGLRGGAGFQFQAVSSGAGHEMMGLVQRSALYEAPVSWMRGKRPVEQYPPSLAHVFDGVYATARGVYLGAEAGGVREGNQFTHAIATADPQLYGPVRPAQLWEAPWWSERPADGTETEPVPAEPEPGPCGVDVLRDWVLGTTGGESWLLALTSALDRVHDENPRRVLFVGADAGEIVRWIAAGTLLLPQERALRVGFRVFATSPQYSRHEVLALHPDWAGQLADTERDSGFAVFDLVSGRHSRIEPTECASHWVSRFLRADPYDVIDAVEMAHRFARDGGRPRPGTGDRLAAGVLTCGDPLEHRSEAAVLADWLASAPPESAQDALEPVAEAVMSAGPDAPALRKLAAAVHSGQDELAGQVWYALLRAELDEVVRGVAATGRGTLPQRRWSPPEVERATSLVESVAAGVAPERFDALLRLAAGFGITPRIDRFRDAAARFVSWWADNPDAKASPSRWSCEPQVLDLLRDELAFRLRGPHADQTVAAIRRHWWPLLLPTVSDPFMRLDAVVAGAAVAEGGQSRREAFAAMRAPLQEPDRPGVGDAVWEALFQDTTPSVAEMLEFFSQMPTATVSESLARKAFPVLERSTVNAEYLEVLRKLVEHVRSEPMRELWKQDGALRRWLTAFQRSDGSESAAALAEVSKPVLSARARDLVDALLGVELSRAVNAAVRGGEAVQTVLVDELAAVWNGNAPQERGDRAVALAFLVAWSDKAADSARAGFDKGLASWVGEHRQSDQRRIRMLLRAVDSDHATAWHEWLRELGKNKQRKPSAARRLFDRLRERGE